MKAILIVAISCSALAEESTSLAIADNKFPVAALRILAGEDS